MKVRFKAGWSGLHGELTAGNVYRVVCIEGDRYRIVDDCGSPNLYYVQAFEVVDATPTMNWQESRDEDGALNAYPADPIRRSFRSRISTTENQKQFDNSTPSCGG